MDALLAGGPGALEALRAAAATSAAGRIASDGVPLAEAELLAPVPRPGKVVAIGRNYREHVAEEQAEPPPAPLVFAKFPSAVIGDGAEIRWDPALTTAGRLGGRARRRHRDDRPARVGRPTPSTTSSATPA